MAISEDTGNQPAAAHTSSATTVGTAAFTPQAATLLVAMVSTNGDVATSATAAITDSGGGTWTLLKRTNAHASGTLAGTAEVWCRYLTVSPGSMTVTGTWATGLAGGNLVVRSLLGASPTQTGVTAGNGGLAIAPTAALAASAVGSWVYGMIVDSNSNLTLTANAQSVIIDQFPDATQGCTWTAFKGVTAVASLASTTYGFTDGNSSFNISVAEILAVSSGIAAVPDTLFRPDQNPITLAPWGGAPDASHDVIVNAQTASISFLSPATRPMMLLALTSESGPGATVITNPDQVAFLTPMLTPDDVTGGMAPWSGAVDGIASVASTTVNAGVASMSFTAQAPSAGLAALPGTGSLTFAAQAPTAAVGALPGTASVTLVAQAPAVALATLPGAAAVSITAQAPVAGLGVLPGAAAITFTGRSALAGPGGAAGVASVTFTARDATAGIAGQPGSASVALSAQGPTAAVSALPGMASVSLTGRDATAGLGALPGTASITTTAPQEISDVGANAVPALIILAAQGAAGVATDGTWDFSAPLFLPDDPYGGMIPWAGATDGMITGDATVVAGVASMILAARDATAGLGIPAGTATMSVVAQAPSAGLSVLPAPGSITLTAQGPTAAVSSLPGTATVSLAGRSAVSGAGAAPGTASVSFVARSASAGLAALPGTGSLTLAANAPQAAVGALPGVASVALAARDSSVGIAALPGASSITFTAPAAGVPGTVIANAGVASISFTARGPVSGAGALPGTASVTFAGRSASSALAALPGSASISLAASGASVVLPQVGTPTLISGREPVSGLSGRESITSASGTETGPISGREPLSSTSGTEAPTTIRGRES